MNAVPPPLAVPTPVRLRTRLFPVPPTLVAVLAWCAAATLLLFVLFGVRSADDPFVTYRYAHNLATGHGLVYNDGVRTLSTTAPLYALLLAGLHLLGLDIPLASNGVSYLSLAAGAAALWALFRRWRLPIAALVVLIAYPFTPLLLVTVGFETPFLLALILWAMVCSEREQDDLAAVLFALATLTRFDAVLAVAVTVVYGVIVQRRKPSWRAVAIYVGLLVPWLVVATMYYGSPLPVTLHAKQMQAVLPQSESFAQGLVPFFAPYARNLVLWPHLACAALGAVALVWYGRAVLVLGWIALYAAAYVALGVTRYGWYYAPLMAGLLLLIALGVQGVTTVVRGRVNARAAMWTVAALGLVLLVGQVWMVVAYRRVDDGRLRIYRAAGDWLRVNTPADRSVGALEIGIIGFYSERPVIDFAGLLQPETAEQFSPSSSYEDAALWASQHFHPDYVVLNDGYFPRLEAMLQNEGACRRANTWSDPAYPATLVAYGCLWR